MSAESHENNVYNILITKGNDSDNQYEFYKERIDSQKDFLYNEYNTLDNDLTDELFEEIDVIILLFGLYHNNQEIFEELINKSNEFDIPLLLVRFFWYGIYSKGVRRKIRCSSRMESSLHYKCD